MRIFSLSIHADYRCSHSGACCTSGWPIPVERRTWERLRTEAADERFVAVDGAPADTPVVAAIRADGGACVFYERESGLCAIHRAHGPSLLPVACQQFPRVSLLDDRGLFVNLSHYCPTAARMLLRDDVDLRVVEAPAAFPGTFRYDPLDAREALPPLLTPSVLMDLETFGRWERAVVATFAQETAAETALTRVAGITERLRTWKPGAVSLADHFDQAMIRGRAPKPAAEIEATGRYAGTDFGLLLDHYRLVLAAIPEPVRPAISVDSVERDYFAYVLPWWRFLAPAVRRYLAAKAFGSWLAYQGRGLRTIVYSLEVVLSVLRLNLAVECGKRECAADVAMLLNAVRRSDEMLVHLASREALARSFSTVERS